MLMMPVSVFMLNSTIPQRCKVGEYIANIYKNGIIFLERSQEMFSLSQRAPLYTHQQAVDVSLLWSRRIQRIAATHSLVNHQLLAVVLQMTTPRHFGDEFGQVRLDMRLGARDILAQLLNGKYTHMIDSYDLALITELPRTEVQEAMAAFKQKEAV
jgi:hypothetical protein